jgi:hypothetical protein
MFRAGFAGSNRALADVAAEHRVSWHTALGPFSRWVRAGMLGVMPSGPPPRRVFLSHLGVAAVPAGRSFVAGAQDAVAKAGDAVTDMAYFPARDDKRLAAVRGE